MGPTAFATPPVLMKLLFVESAVLTRDAVVVPSAKATLFDTNDLRDDDEEEIEPPDAELEGEGMVMCNLVGA